MQFQALHTATNGDRYWLVSPPSTNGVYTINQFFVNSVNTFDQSEWIIDSDIKPDGLKNLDIKNISNVLFNFYGQNFPVNNKFSAELPAFPTQGGTLQIYLSPLYYKESFVRFNTFK